MSDRKPAIGEIVHLRMFPNGYRPTGPDEPVPCHAAICCFVHKGQPHFIPTPAQQHDHPAAPEHDPSGGSPEWIHSAYGIPVAIKFRWHFLDECPDPTGCGVPR